MKHRVSEEHEVKIERWTRTYQKNWWWEKWLQTVQCNAEAQKEKWA